MVELRRLTPRSNRSLSEEVYRALREAVLQGGLKPNERLVETQLAEALGVSRTPVREAIHRLEMDGLVHSLPNRSTVAAWYSLEDIQHIYSIRARVEGYAARLLAEKVTSPLISRLDKLCQKFEQASSQQQDLLNRQFHKTIVDASEVKLVIQMATSLVEHTLMWRLYQLHTPEDRARSLLEHRAIVDALRERNAPAADRLVREHLEWARDILLTRNR